jgi:diguanylate cyclase (GGDEF)-like protein
VPGAAVYVKTQPHGRFRAHVNWVMQDADPRSPFSLPYVFERIQETGAPLILPDLTPQPADAVQRGSIDDVIRGLAAAPLIGRAGRVLGTICVFDVKPLSPAVDVDALLALGRRVGPMLEALAPAQMDVACSSEPDGEATRNDPAVPLAASETDDVTGLPTRGAGHEIIAVEIDRAQHNHLPLSLLLLRVDDFAALEERNDRALVDRVLRTIGRVVTGALRRTDSAIRWNAAEFLVVLPEIGVDTARDVAERIRAATEATSSRELPCVTMSGGVTEVPPGGALEEALRRLEGLVNDAGKSGGNRIS